MTDRTDVFLSTLAVPISPLVSASPVGAGGPNRRAAAVPMGSKFPPGLSGFHCEGLGSQFRHNFFKNGVGMYFGFRCLRRKRRSTKARKTSPRITPSAAATIYTGDVSFVARKGCV